MEKKTGNQRRCRKCNRLAGIDYFCRKHRPPKPIKKRVRDNYLDDNFMTKETEFWGDSYGSVREDYPCVKRG